MEQFTYFAQATDNYNCVGASDSSYGAGAFGDCVNSTTGGNTGGNTGTNNNTSNGTTQPGAPNTGEFFGFVTSGAFSIILPLVIAIVIVAAASFAVVRKKRANQR